MLVELNDTVIFFAKKRLFLSGNFDFVVQLQAVKSENCLLWVDVKSKKPVFPLEKLNFEFKTGDTFIIYTDLSFKLMSWFVQIPQAKLVVRISNGKMTMTIEELPSLRFTDAIMNILGLQKLLEVVTKSFSVTLSVSPSATGDPSSSTLVIDGTSSFPYSMIAGSLIRQNSPFVHRAFFSFFKFIEGIFKALSLDLSFLSEGREPFLVEEKKSNFNTLADQFDAFLLNHSGTSEKEDSQNIAFLPARDYLFSTHESKIRLRGSLFKLAINLRKWNEKELLLEDSRIFIFRKSADEKPYKIILLSNHSLQEPFNEKLLSKVCFKLINNRTGEEIVLGDDDSEQVSLWVSKIKEAMVSI